MSAPLKIKELFPNIPIKKQKDNKNIDFLNLESDLKKLNKPLDTLMIINIFYQYEKHIPIHDDPLTITLDKLSPLTINELKEYSKKLLNSL